MAKLMDENEARNAYDDALDESGPVTVAGYEFDPSRILREVDPIAYRTGFTDYLDAMGWTLEASEADDDDEDEDEDGEPRFSEYPGKIFLTSQGFVGVPD